MKTRITLPMMTMVAAASTPGCYSTWDLKPEMVWELDGFNGSGKTFRVVEDQEKKDITVTSDTYLHFYDANELEVRAQFRSLHLEGPVLVGIEKNSGDQLNVDLRRIKLVQASELSSGKTAGAVVGYTLGLVPLGFGLLYGAIFATQFGVVEGRPLRVPGESSPIAAPLVARGVRHGRQRISDTHESTRAGLFARWAKAATEECASIPAFLALARDLSRASAPARLVRAARRAAHEEANHTRLCTNLANEHADTLIEARRPNVPVSMETNEEALLRRLALEAFWDGCVGEGVAAAVARRSASRAKDESTRLALQTIAHDEAGHAALARDILEYCLSAGGRPIRHALLESLELRRMDEESEIAALSREAEAEPVVDWDLAERFGMPTTQTRIAARVETWEKNVAMLTMA
ncbi:MAG TPA: hypothetical protein PK156_06125 [Polyangium sp.]|nr:hypothetical protein [Polyangium sp.]